MNALRLPATTSLLAIMTLMGGAQMARRPTERVAPRVAKPAQSAAGSLPSPLPITINRSVIVIDAAHGGVDSGSQISDTTVEKDVTLALAFRLRSMLTARGFTVVMTRDADSPSQPGAAGTALTLDDRAGIANHAHAAACLLLHATGSGNGVHLYSSELDATAGALPVAPWLTAQAAWVPESRKLEKQFAAALTRSGIALVTSSASVRPMDSLQCPASVVELAPSGDDADSINDTDYQQRVALSLAGSLLFWQNQVQPPMRISESAHGNVGTVAGSHVVGAQL
ncbi:MAG: N-acetylmuramoyl-L-alanine amidase [Acidobacteriaceae bacterium]